MRVFITGATGVVGRRLVPILRAEGHTITGVARSPAGRAQLERHGAAALSLDLFDATAVRRAVVAHDAVVNLATHIPPPARIFLRWAWRENDRLRRDASATLAEASVAAEVSRFVQESFAPVYRDSGDRWIDETIPIEPVKYNRSIADAEASAERFSRSGRTGITLRFGAFYGPDADQTIELIKYLRRGWAPLPGRPGAYISSVSHDDAATAVAAALALPPGIYNVVDDEPVTHEEYVGSLAKVLHVPPPKLPPRWATVLFGSLAALAARSVRISNRKLRANSTWVPSHPTVSTAWAGLIAQIEGDRR
jgi:nucleoside-diphosphate-sugar epimerase